MPLDSKPSQKKSNGPYGRLQDRAALALAIALERGATPLEAQVVYEVAAQPGPNWMPGREIIERVNVRTNSHHHPGSGRRAVRDAERKGLLGVTRVLPFQRPQGAKYSSPHGTTSKRVLWSGLRVRDPVSKHELSRMRHEARTRSRYRTIEAEPDGSLETRVNLPGTPRHGSAQSLVTRTPPARKDGLYDEFAAMAAGAIDATERRDAARDMRRDRAMLSSIAPKGRAPPRA